MSTPPDDRQQVQSRRTTSLSLLQHSKFPREALYSLLRAANQELDRTLGREHLVPDNDAYQVEVTVRTTARPQGSTDV